MVALHGALVLHPEGCLYCAAPHLPIDSVETGHVISYLLLEVLRQLDGLHFYPELLQLLDGGLYLENGSLLFDPREEETAMNIQKLDLQIEAHFVCFLT